MQFEFRHVVFSQIYGTCSIILNISFKTYYYFIKKYRYLIKKIQIDVKMKLQSYFIYIIIFTHKRIQILNYSYTKII